jgi:PAS domain S-box-containing protein
MPGERTVDIYRNEMVDRVAGRVPLGFGVFLLCLALSVGFEIASYPERRAWMGAFAAGFLALVATAWGLVRLRPSSTVPIMIGFVNAVGVAINAYHAIVGASLAMCIWQLTALLASSALILPWGQRSQALACIGALVSYPVHLQFGTSPPLTWAAGGTYLLVVTCLSVFGAALFARFMRTDLQLTAALTEREARLKSYFDLSLVGTAIVAADGRCVEVNEEICRMFGYTADELLGTPWPTLVHPDARPVAIALVAQALAGAPERLDLRCVRKDGDILHATVAARGLPGPRNTIKNVMVLLHDITDRKLAELARERSLAATDAARRQAEEASRAKDAFLATVSHELRTPLTPILAWSTILQADAAGDPKRVAALQTIERNARAQARLIEDLLDVSRIVSGEWRLTLRPVDLAGVIRAAVDVVRPSADVKEVALTMAVPSAPCIVQGDPSRLEQVVWNLLVNGVKFAPRGGHVEVVLERSGARARVLVRDNGSGIRPEFLPHVFERFRQADGSSTRQHGGLGLGLAIVRALVELHGGVVRAESGGENRGAVFTVELPLVAGETAFAAGAIHASEPPPPSLAGLRVLLVDDDLDSNTVVHTLLTSCGAEVRMAASADEALDIASDWQPDVLVSDIAMPDEDGVALLRRLRARGGSFARLPAVALTAYAGPGDRRRLLAAGFQAHVGKPFSPSELASIVEGAAHADASRTLQ